MAATVTEVLVDMAGMATEATELGTGTTDTLMPPSPHLFRPLSPFQYLLPFVFPFAEQERWAAAKWAEVDMTSTAMVMVTARRRSRPERHAFNTEQSATKEARWDQETEDAENSALNTTCRLRLRYRHLFRPGCSCS